MKIYADYDKTIGKVNTLVKVSDWYEFKDKIRTENHLGITLQIVLVNNEFDKVNVHIKGKTVEDKNKLENDIKNAQENGKYLAVKFIEPTVKVYGFNKIGVSVSAKGFEIVSK
ncbi:MAG: hypothetical protein L0G13_02525 [Lactococcus lactis]|nr:hypothetical protein [Lactococcus lactis]